MTLFADHDFLEYNIETWAAMTKRFRDGLLVVKLHLSGEVIAGEMKITQQQIIGSMLMVLAVDCKQRLILTEIFSQGYC